MNVPSILLVDDSPDVATIVRLLARRAGWQTQVAVSAEIGHQFLQAPSAYDLVLVDQNLPGMTGLELIQKVLGTIHSPLVVFVQSSLVEDLARAVRVGVRYCLYKDTLTDPAEWTQRCREIMDAARGIFQPWLLELLSTYSTEPNTDHPPEQMAQIIESGLGGDLGRILTPALMEGLQRDEERLRPEADSPSALPRTGMKALHALVFCWRLLGTSRVHGLRKVLEPLLSETSSRGHTA